MSNAMEEGEAAYHRGETFGDNPYPKGTLKHHDWNMGMGDGATEENLKKRARIIRERDRT